MIDYKHQKTHIYSAATHSPIPQYPSHRLYAYTVDLLNTHPYRDRTCRPITPSIRTRQVSTCRNDKLGDMTSWHPLPDSVACMQSQRFENGAHPCGGAPCCCYPMRSRNRLQIRWLRRIWCCFYATTTMIFVRRLIGRLQIDSGGAVCTVLSLLCLRLESLL
jgi:hypothetical protein